MNFKTVTYGELKELKKELTAYIATIHEDVDQLVYPDYNRVSSAVKTALSNIANDPLCKDFCEFMSAFEDPATSLWQTWGISAKIFSRSSSWTAYSSSQN